MALFPGAADPVQGRTNKIEVVTDTPTATAEPDGRGIHYVAAPGHMAHVAIPEPGVYEIEFRPVTTLWDLVAMAGTTYALLYHAATHLSRRARRRAKRAERERGAMLSRDTGIVTEEGIS